VDTLEALRYRFGKVEATEDDGKIRYSFYKLGLKHIVWVEEKVTLTIHGCLCGRNIVLTRTFPKELDLGQQIINIIDNALSQAEEKIN
jgi:hypothetical protein